MAKEELTDKQEKFVQELLKDKSQREAYRTAYPKSIKWSDKTVDERASRLYNDYKVFTRYKELHDKLMAASEEEAIMSAKEVLKELSIIGRARIDDFLKVDDKEIIIGYKDGEDGEPEPITHTKRSVEIYRTDDMDKDKIKAISEIRETKDGIALKLSDKQKALESLGRHWGLFTDKVDMNVNTTRKLDDIISQIGGDGLDE